MGRRDEKTVSKAMRELVDGDRRRVLVLVESWKHGKMVEAWIGGNRRVLDPSIHPVKKGEVI